MRHIGQEIRLRCVRILCHRKRVFEVVRKLLLVFFFSTEQRDINEDRNKNAHDEHEREQDSLLDRLEHRAVELIDIFSGGVYDGVIDLDGMLDQRDDVVGDMIFHKAQIIGVILPDTEDIVHIFHDLVIGDHEFVDVVLIVESIRGEDSHLVLDATIGLFADALNFFEIENVALCVC